MEQQQTGIFIRSKQDAKRDFKVSGFSALRHLRVCNQMMIAAVQNNKLVCRSLSSSTKQNEINLQISSSDMISHVHLSPTGFHSIVSCKSGENFYISLKNNNVTHIKKIKEQITAVAWNPDAAKDTETGSILLGTEKGAIYETSFQSTGSMPLFKEQAANFGGSDNSSLPGNQAIIEMRLFLVSEDDPKAAKCVLFICKPYRLYSLYATINLVPVARSYMSTASLQNFVSLPESPQHIFHPFFSKDVQQTCLSMPPAEHLPAEPTSALVFYASNDTCTYRFFWLGPHGYTFGTINLAADRPGDVIHEEKHLEHRRFEGKLESPVGVTITEFHVLLAYTNRLAAMSHFTYQVVYEDSWPVDLGCAIGITSDPIAEFHWLYTATYILKYRPNDEARYVWKTFLDRGDFVRAQTVARERQKIEPAALELVLKRQAEKFITERNFTAAAEILAQSSEPFETVVLKFLTNDRHARLGLKVFLEKKLERWNGVEDRLKRDAVVTWLLDIQLSELAEARRNGDNKAANEFSTQLQHFIMKKPILEAIYGMKEGVYNLAVSHADFDTQLFLALQFQDYETAINIYLLRNQHKKVLEILVSKCASTDAFLKYGPHLIDEIPMELFLALMQNERIRPQALLPLLYQCQSEPRTAMPALKYLEEVIKKPYGHDVQIHNFLTLLYARHRPNRLLDYLMERGRDKTTVPYDIDFAIRTCRQYNQPRSLVFLHCVNENFQKAVEMALEIGGVEYAKECARLMDPNEEDIIMGIESRYPKELRRKIWMLIASFIIDKGGSAEQCIDLLKESSNAICIQDIFPLFPDFTKIEHVKDSLCECLKDHSNTIKDIQQTLKEANDVAQTIKDRTERLKNRVTVVKAGDHCAGCQRSLANRPFFPFACRHFFHRECLEEAMTSFLDYASQKKLADLIERERNILIQLDADDRSPTKKLGLSEREMRYNEIALEISDLLGAECPHCGSIAIEIIDRPFFSDVEYANDLDSWHMNNEDAHWKFTWPSATVLAQFVVTNGCLFRDAVVVELGAGATGVVGLAAAAAGAAKVVLTEDSKNIQAVQLLRENADANMVAIGSKAEVTVAGLDWFTSISPRRNEPGDIRDFLSTLDQCDYLVASDVFYHVELFRPLIQTIALFSEKFPRLRVYFAYHLRDENHSIEDLLYLEGLSCSLVRSVDSSSTIQIGLIYKSGGQRRMFAGIEGGATHSLLVFLDEAGNHVAEHTSKGTNMCLEGVQVIGDQLAQWVREKAKENDIALPLKALGMGLSGAEDDALNRRFVEYLQSFHGDIAEHFSLNSDSICLIKASFDKEGVVMIAGTGSTVRLLKADGSSHGVGGWGHIIGDGGSGFWVSQRAIRVLYDDDDGLERACGGTATLRKTILEHFDVTDKTNILPLLYSDFNKPRIASLCEALAKNGDDPVIAKVFYDNGYILGRQMAALSRHMDEEMLNDVRIVTIGSVFKSWHLCSQGFLDALKETNMKKVSFCQPADAPAIGAAVLAAREANLTLEVQKQAEPYQTWDI